MGASLHFIADVSAILNIHVVALCGSDIQLTGAADFELWIGDHFLPLRDPAYGA